MFKMGVKYLLRKNNAYLYYMHPWEIDCGQPKVERASKWKRIKHYTNIEKTETKLKKLIYYLREYDFVTCHRYLKTREKMRYKGNHRPLGGGSGIQ